MQSEAKMLRLVALSALLYLAAAQSDPTVQVNGGGVNPPSAIPSVLSLEPLVLG